MNKKNKKNKNKKNENKKNPQSRSAYHTQRLTTEAKRIVHPIGPHPSSST